MRAMDAPEGDETMTPATRVPVTTGGWYERTDGSVGHYEWVRGQLTLVNEVATWGDVRAAQEAEPEEPPPLQDTTGRDSMGRHEAAGEDEYFYADPEW